MQASDSALAARVTEVSEAGMIKAHALVQKAAVLLHQLASF